MSSTKKAAPNEAQIKKWKAEYPKGIYRLTKEVSGKVLEVYFRHPSLEHVSLASVEGAGDRVVENMSFYRNCKLYASPELEGNDELQASFGAEIGKSFKVYQYASGPIDLTLALEGALTSKNVPLHLVDRTKQFKELRRIEVQGPNGKLVGYLAKPQLEDRSAAENGPTMIEKGHIYLNQLWMWGDEELKSGDDEEILFSACLAASGIFKMHAVEIEKL